MPKVVYSDKRYVHLEVSEREVQEALDNSDTDGPYVVLLHGGPGRGKSTLVRYMEISYTLQERRSQASFDRVVLLECGPEVKEIKSFELKLVELSQQLVIGLEATNASEEDRKFGEALKKRLVGFLREKKILLILDDVFEEKFLEMIVDLCGTQVKCLVTSQKATLCRNIANSSHIEIQEITQEVAKKILASHVGLDSHQIPEGLEDVADKIVEETDRNPLALASVATALAYKRSRDSDDWQRAYEDFYKLLASENTLQIHKRNYPRSFLSTMNLCVDSLNEKVEWQPAQKLLILTAICKGPSIPQVVIEVLWGRIGNLGSFIKLANELENRKLITLRRESLPWDVVKKDLKVTLWSMHSLQKRFIVEEMKADIISVVCSLDLGTEPKMEGEIIKELRGTKEEMPTILCALYLGDEVLVRRAASKMHISSENLKSMPLRRNAMEPILWLLGQPGSKPWRDSATQVFSRYICTGMLDDEGISHLLGMSDALVTPATLRALTRVGDTEGPYIDESKQGLMQALVGFLLAEEVDTNIKKEAITTLGRLSTSMHHKAFIVFFPRVLEGLADLLEDSHPLLQEAATSAFADLAYYRDMNAMVEMRHKTQVKIAKTHGVLEGLIKLFGTDDNPILQKWAACAIANLALGNDEIKLEVVRCPGALDGLVLLISKEETLADIRKQGARAIANLARGDDEIKLEVVRCCEALDGLVLLISEETPADLRKHGARAIANLARGNDEIKLEVVRCRGALDGLVLLISRQETPTDLREHGARAIANLARGNDEIKLKVVRCRGALDGLVLLISEETPAGLREHGARAIANLGQGNDEIKLEVVRCRGALDGLVLLLSKEETLADLRKHCAKAIANLAAGTDEIKLEVVSCCGALDGLVLSLPNPVVQESSGRALFDLASSDTIRVKMREREGSMEDLTRLLVGQVAEESSEEWAAGVLTLLDPVRGNGAHLHSGPAYFARGRANLLLCLYVESLADLDKAHQLCPSDAHTLSHRTVVKTKLGDFQGAFEDANKCIELRDTAFGLQERGVLKRLMGDLDGALADFDEGLRLGPDNYEMLKHRGFVKFKMKDEDGARADAECAMRVKPCRVDDLGYGRGFLGGISVEYLGYKLT